MAKPTNPHGLVHEATWFFRWSSWFLFGKWMTLVLYLLTVALGSKKGRLHVLYETNEFVQDKKWNIFILFSVWKLLDLLKEDGREEVTYQMLFIRFHFFLPKFNFKTKLKPSLDFLLKFNLIICIFSLIDRHQFCQ